MSALAEALLAAQRQAVASLSKAYVGNHVDPEEFHSALDRIGLRDAVDQGLLVEALRVLKTYGGEAPKATGQTAESRKAPEQASDAQRKYIADLCKQKNVEPPDVIVSKEQAHEIIEALKAGTYNADAYTVPF